MELFFVTAASTFLACLLVQIVRQLLQAVVAFLFSTEFGSASGGSGSNQTETVGTSPPSQEPPRFEQIAFYIIASAGVSLLVVSYIYQISIRELVQDHEIPLVSGYALGTISFYLLAHFQENKASGKVLVHTNDYWLAGAFAVLLIGGIFAPYLDTFLRNVNRVDAFGVTAQFAATRDRIVESINAEFAIKDENVLFNEIHQKGAILVSTLETERDHLLHEDFEGSQAEENFQALADLHGVLSATLKCLVPAGRFGTDHIVTHLAPLTYALDSVLVSAMRADEGARADAAERALREKRHDKLAKALVGLGSYLAKFQEHPAHDESAGPARQCYHQSLNKDTPAFRTDRSGAPSTGVSWPRRWPDHPALGPGGLDLSFYDAANYSYLSLLLARLYLVQNETNKALKILEEQIERTARRPGEPPPKNMVNIHQTKAYYLYLSGYHHADVLAAYADAWDGVQSWCVTLDCRNPDSFAEKVEATADRRVIKSRIKNGELLLANGRSFATAQAVLSREEGWRGLKHSLQSDLERLEAFIDPKQTDAPEAARPGCYRREPGFTIAIYDTWAVGTVAYELAFGEPAIGRVKLRRAQSYLEEAIQCHEKRHQSAHLNRWVLSERKTLKSHLAQVEELMDGL